MSLLSPDNLRKKCRFFKKDNKLIVFTNGCFDLLHKGHKDLLNKASTYGDILIVGINSDSSVKSIKGENRPIEEEITRVDKLLKLDCVDYVIIFDSKTPENIIKIISPDVLVKGGDYDLNNIVGAQYVIKNGGDVKIVPLTPGYSTTSILKSNNR